MRAPGVPACGVGVAGWVPVSITGQPTGMISFRQLPTGPACTTSDSSPPTHPHVHAPTTTADNFARTDFAARGTHCVTVANALTRNALQEGMQEGSDVDAQVAARTTTPLCAHTRWAEMPTMNDE